MNDEFRKCEVQFDKVVYDAQVLLSIARDSDLQRGAIAQLSELKSGLGNSKQEAIAEKDEDLANLILGMESFADALQAELKMWLLLKSEKPDEAWEQLVASQKSTAHAIRAHKKFSDQEHRARYLDVIEKVVFPPQVFFSSGLIVSRQICSICNMDYENCAHMVGLPYWGEFCFRILKDVVVDHIAIVSNPANKLCRMTHFSVEGGRRNRMTWRVELSDSHGQQVSDRDD